MMRIRDIQFSQRFYRIEHHLNLYQARARLLHHQTHSELVVHNDKRCMLGILTRRALLAQSNRDYFRKTLADLDYAPLICISEDESLQRACDVMMEWECHHILIETNGKRVGIVSSLDVVRAYDTEPLVDASQAFLHYAY